MPVVTDFQCSYNGLSFGAFTDVGLTEIEGLSGFDTRSLDIPKSRQNGAWAGLNLIDERAFTLSLEVIAPTAPFSTVTAAIATAFGPISDPDAQLPLEIRLPGWAESRIIMCRPTKGALPIDRRFSYHDGQFMFEMTAPDPLLYSSTLHSASAGLPTPTAGLTFPVTFNVTFGASTGGSMSVTNLGNYITAPLFTIAGPVTNPTISFPASGQFMTFGIALGPSDTLTVDMANRTVLLNGTADRYNTIVTGSSWFGFPPGTWSVGVASTDSAAVAAVFTVQWRDAWAMVA